MRWLESILKPLCRRAREPETGTAGPHPQRKPCSRLIHLPADEIGVPALAIEEGGSWRIEAYDSETALRAARRSFDPVEELWQLDFHCPERRLDKALSPEEKRRIGLAIKRDIGRLFPRFLLAEACQGVPPRRLEAIAPAPAGTEVWIARQDLDPLTFLAKDWRIKRVWPIAKKPRYFTHPKNAPVDEMAVAVISRQEGRSSFLFVEDSWRHARRVPMAVRLAIAGIPVPDLRNGEACIGLTGVDRTRAACFLSADGMLRGWVADRADPADLWLDGASIDGCRTLTLRALPLEHDVGVILDPDWIARASRETVAAALIDILPYLKPVEARTPWKAIAKGERDHDAESGIDHLAKLACRSDPDMMNRTIHITGRLPAHPIAGRVRFLPGHMQIFGECRTTSRSSPVKERLALILNLAAAGLTSWSSDADEQISLIAEGATSAHELIEATEEMSAWWIANRGQVPQSWTSVSPWGDPLRRSVIEALDCNLAV